MADSRVERLFCCECGAELRGEPARVIPPLQPGGKGAGGNTRPHVWCHRCLALEVAEAEARPKPHELEQDPAFELHRYIWTVGEGRTDEEIRRCWGTYVRAGVKLSTTLRRLTEAGKIEKRGDRRVALCSPWSCCETVEGLAYDVPIHEQVSCSPPQQVARTREASRGNVVPSLRAARKLDPAEQDADDALPTPEELQADRYVGGIPQVDLQDINDRLKRLERLVEHLVIMDNEREQK